MSMNLIDLSQRKNIPEIYIPKVKTNDSVVAITIKDEYILHPFRCNYFSV